VNAIFRYRRQLHCGAPRRPVEHFGRNSILDPSGIIFNQYFSSGGFVNAPTPRGAPLSFARHAASHSAAVAKFRFIS